MLLDTTTYAGKVMTLFASRHLRGQFHTDETRGPFTNME